MNKALLPCIFNEKETSTLVFDSKDRSLIKKNRKFKISVVLFLITKYLEPTYGIIQRVVFYMLLQLNLECCVLFH